MDQLMSLAWKLMLPMALVNILVAGIWHFMPTGVVRWIICAIPVAAAYVLLSGLLAGGKQFGKRVYRYAD